MKHIWKAAALLVAALTVTSCNNNKFTVEGQISNAKDSVLYFENVGLEGINILDSVKLGDNGDFSFSEAATPAPEFYRIRISDQIINVSIDSTETVQIKAEYPGMAANYTVSGSDNCEKIKELTLKQMALQEQAIAIQKNISLGIDGINDSIQKIVDTYKNEVKLQYIFKEPNKAYSYFALFQTLGNWLIFNPRTSKDDIKAFAAVATSWDTYYPHALRGQNLHNIAIEGMKNVRIMENKKTIQLDISKMATTGNIDIRLIDNKGQQRSLSDLKGQVVLLDFHLFQAKESTARIMQLRELYNKYHDRGFTIYQVSVDPDEHYWKQQTAALPWVSVREPNGVESTLMGTFNIQAIPTFFTVGRDGALHQRDVQIKDLDAEIQSLL